MLTVTTWLWGDKFSLDDVMKLRGGVRRNLIEPHRFLLFTDRPLRDLDDIEVFPILDAALTAMPGCFARLRLFDPELQNFIGVMPEPSSRIVNMDLDSIITASLDGLFDGPDEFKILQGGNAANPCPYNGALFMLRPGIYPDVWHRFAPDTVKTITYFEFPDDQGWLWHMVPFAAGWKCGPESHCYVFRKPGWPAGDDLPNGARFVTFNGWRRPSKFTNLSWVQNHWRA